MIRAAAIAAAERRVVADQFSRSLTVVAEMQARLQDHPGDVPQFVFQLRLSTDGFARVKVRFHHPSGIDLTTLRMTALQRPQTLSVHIPSAEMS